MNPLSIVGVSRGNEYSPNHVDNDAAIFRLVADELRALGCTVSVYPERDFVARGVRADYIFDMARGRAAIARLKQLEDEGALVVNSAYGIDNCVRRPMTELLLRHGIPHPRSRVVPADAPFPEDCFPCWIKRGDSHAMVREDVCYAGCREEAERVMADFRRRGIPAAVVNEHLEGDLVKFYGVQDTGFFHWFYPTPDSHSKFGLERINGKPRGIPFDAEELKAYGNRAAEALRVPVYGGDCVVSADGRPRIIDFNDWPSFARCRDEAAPQIAACIHRRALRRRETSGGRP